jgi:hypothetical protein
MIGGVDVVFNTQISSAESLDLCTSLVAGRWPEAIFENAITGEQYAGYAAIPFGLVSELMIYRDRTAFESWQHLGADPSNANTMVHLLACEPGEITAVVDDPRAAEAEELLREMGDRLAKAPAKAAAEYTSHLRSLVIASGRPLPGRGHLKSTTRQVPKVTRAMGPRPPSAVSSRAA